MLQRELRSFAARPVMLQKTIAHGDLIDPDSGDHQDVVIGTFPAGTRLVARGTKVTAYFTGGSASAVTITLGTAAAPTLFMTALNIFDTTALNVWQQGTAGAQPVGDVGGTELIARVDLVGDSLLNLTAGSLVVELFGFFPDLDLRP